MRRALFNKNLISLDTFNIWTNFFAGKQLFVNYCSENYSNKVLTTTYSTRLLFTIWLCTVHITCICIMLRFTSKSLRLFDLLAALCICWLHLCRHLRLQATQQQAHRRGHNNLVLYCSVLRSVTIPVCINYTVVQYYFKCIYALLCVSQYKCVSIVFFSVTNEWICSHM